MQAFAASPLRAGPGVANATQTTSDDARSVYAHRRSLRRLRRPRRLRQPPSV